MRESSGSGRSVRDIGLVEGTAAAAGARCYSTWPGARAFPRQPRPSCPPLSFCCKCWVARKHAGLTACAPPAKSRSATAVDSSHMDERMIQEVGGLERRAREWCGRPGSGLITISRSARSTTTAGGLSHRWQLIPPKGRRPARSWLQDPTSGGAGTQCGLADGGGCRSCALRSTHAMLGQRVDCKRAHWLAAALLPWYGRALEVGKLQMVAR